MLTWILVYPTHYVSTNLEYPVTPFHTTDLILQPLKKVMFLNVFKGYGKRPVAWNGLISVALITFNVTWSSFVL